LPVGHFPVFFIESLYLSAPQRCGFLPHLFPPLPRITGGLSSSEISLIIKLSTKRFTWNGLGSNSNLFDERSANNWRVNTVALARPMPIESVGEKKFSHCNDLI
jgi:hypothetical protein